MNPYNVSVTVPKGRLNVTVRPSQYLPGRFVIGFHDLDLAIYLDELAQLDDLLWAVQCAVETAEVPR